MLLHGVDAMHGASAEHNASALNRQSILGADAHHRAMPPNPSLQRICCLDMRAGHSLLLSGLLHADMLCSSR